MFTAGPLATSSAAAMDLIPANSGMLTSHFIITVSNGAAFDWSPDGGATWSHVPADPSSNPINWGIPGINIGNNALKLRRDSGTDCTGVYITAW